MFSFKAVTAICLGVTLCSAQPICISGYVKDIANVGISGAIVKLEVVNISTTTESDGSFILTNGLTQIQPNLRSSSVESSPIQIHNEKIIFTLFENTHVNIDIYNVSGKQIYSSKKTYGSGTHAIVRHQKSTEITLNKVKIGKEAYSFISSPLGTHSTEHSTTFRNSSAMANQARAMTGIADVIAVFKEGQLNYRDSIKAPDTSGIVIKMIPNAGNVTDADGNVYQSVQIGNKVWSVENLRTTKYTDGTSIPGPIFSEAQWVNLTNPAYCWYKDSTGEAYRQKWGALYNWYVVNPSNPKKIAPDGWRVPSDVDWTAMQNYLISNGCNWDGTTSGNKIAKAMATQTDWTNYYDAGATGNNPSKNNASGFSSLPGGCRANDGYFYSKGNNGYWWSSTEDTASHAWGRNLYYYGEYLYRIYEVKRCGFSVRLLRDSN